ncbi:hypothetical protein ACWFR5_12995 [Streptomyces sp. NPDC055092]
MVPGRGAGDRHRSCDSEPDPKLVDLGFAEIRGSAVGSLQVSRRMPAGLDDLLLAPEERAVRDDVDRDFVLRPDRQRIG